MRLDIELESEKRLSLESAILLYAGHHSHYATVHEIKQGANNVPYLLPGSPLSRAGLTACLDSLSARGQRRILPPNMVCCEPGFMAWTKRSHVSAFFANSTDAEFNKAMRRSVVVHPDLLFVAEDGGKLSVFALIGTEGLTAETRVYQAPYPNIYNNGLMCTGNVRMPERAEPTATQIAFWEMTFFETTFTHPNAMKLTSHPGGWKELWKASKMIAAEAQRTKTEPVFPTEHLLPGAKLGEVLGIDGVARL